MHLGGVDGQGHPVDPSSPLAVIRAYGMSFIDIPVNPVLNVSSDDGRSTEQHIADMLAYAQESAEFYLGFLIENGQPIPAPRPAACVAIPDEDKGEIKEELVGLFEVPVRIPKVLYEASSPSKVT